MAKKIKSFKSTRPKEYWDILNRRTDLNVLKHISLGILHDHFAKLNAAKHDSNDIEQSHVTVAPDPILDNYITHDEINKAINSFKCNKSCGLDQIINEYILKSGIMPEGWCVGVIKPLYKGKADKSDLDNYWGITIVSWSHVI